MRALQQQQRRAGGGGGSSSGTTAAAAAAGASRVPVVAVVAQQAKQQQPQQQKQQQQLQQQQQQQQQQSLLLGVRRAAAAAAATAAAVALQLSAVQQPPAFAAAVAGPQAAAAQAAAASGAAAAPSSSSSSSSPSWRPVAGDLALAAAAPASPASPASPAERERLAAAEAEARAAVEEGILEDVALPPELRRFMELIRGGGREARNPKALSAARRAVGFDRSPDGRVFLLADLDQEPFQLRNDMGVAGALLLRDAGGYVYYLPPGDVAGGGGAGGGGAGPQLAQIDLSDDAVVAQLFANHAWEELVEPLEVVADGAAPDAAASRQGQQGLPPGAAPADAHLEQLRLTEREFRSVISLLAGAQELPEEPLEDLDAAEGGPSAKAAAEASRQLQHTSGLGDGRQ